MSVSAAAKEAGEAPIVPTECSDWAEERAKKLFDEKKFRSTAERLLLKLLQCKYTKEIPDDRTTHHAVKYVRLRLLENIVKWLRSIGKETKYTHEDVIYHSLLLDLKPQQEELASVLRKRDRERAQISADGPWDYRAKYARAMLEQAAENPLWYGTAAAQTILDTAVGQGDQKWVWEPQAASAFMTGDTFDPEIKYLSDAHKKAMAAFVDGNASAPSADAHVPQGTSFPPAADEPHQAPASHKKEKWAPSDTESEGDDDI